MILAHPPGYGKQILDLSLAARTIHLEQGIALGVKYYYNSIVFWSAVVG